MTSIQEESLEHLCSIIGLSKDEGLKYLDVCHGNVQMAIGMYYDSNFGELGGVRAPIPQRTERLANDYIYYPNNNTARREDRDDGQEMLEDQFMWTPLELIYRGTFKTACEHATSVNKWLLVNVQKSDEFPCSVLNRDVWNNAEVKKIIEKYFVFWQVNSDSNEGRRYIQFYKATLWPYVSIIDPRTGENVLYCQRDVLVSGDEFCRFATEFLSCNKSPDDEDTLSHTEFDGVLDASEEEQLRIATEASLKSKELTFYADDSDDEYDRDANFIEQPEELTIEDCLGPSTDPITKLLLRLPTGERKILEWPCSTKLRALFIYVEKQGFKEFVITTSFPRIAVDSRKMDEVTLLDAKFHPQQALFVNLL